MPFAVAASSVPILAFAPLFNNWFGLDQQLSKAMIAAALCFFPVHDQHRPRPDDGRPAGARAAAFLCGPRVGGVPQAARAQRAAVRLHGAPPGGRRSRRSARSSASTSRLREPASASTSRRIRRSSTSSGRGRRSCSRARSASGSTSSWSSLERLVMPWHAAPGRLVLSRRVGVAVRRRVAFARLRVGGGGPAPGRGPATERCPMRLRRTSRCSRRHAGRWRPVRAAGLHRRPRQRRARHRAPSAAASESASRALRPS